MSILLGIRIAFAGGRESAARIVLVVTGVAVGVVLLLFSLTVMPALQGRIDRYAWHRTDASSPATAPDPALWLAVTDRHEGRNVIRVHVAALGAHPPVPPGLDRLPGPGEVVVSPALADRFRTVPDDQLRNRFPGRITGTIGPDGLISPEELVAIVGHTAEELLNTAGADEIRGFEQPGEPIDLKRPLQVLITMAAVLLIGPVVVFVSMVARVDAARREQRFAAIRLAGATRWQTAVLAATETAVAAIGGALLGWCGYLVARPILADNLRYEGTVFPLDDLTAPTWQVVLVLAAVPLIAVAATLVALHRVQITPLGVRRRMQHPPPRAWRLIPLAAGIAGIIVMASRGRDPDAVDDSTLRLLGVLSPLSIVVGLVLAGPWVCMWVSRGLARLSGRATTLIAARRITSDPFTAFRAVSGVAVAMFVATAVGLVVTGDRAGRDSSPSVLDPGVVAVHVRGASEAALAPLISDDVVVARSGPSGQVVVRCADLARVSELTCPLPARLDHHPPPVGLFDPAGFAEPGPGAADLPIRTLFVPTDGTPAAEERVRTLAAVAAPYALSRTGRDWARDDPGPFGGPESVVWLAMMFILLVAACSLTVSVVAGLIARRRPFALLRASGVRLHELRQIALLETAIPLVLTVLGGFGTAVLVAYIIVPNDEWTLPGIGFFASVGVGVLVALAVSLITWPLMDVATRHDSVRFE
jgi:hypothetical protein